MSGNRRIHHRRSIRLPGYDYAQAGAYFVTMCTHDRACLFGRVVDGEMRLNALGEIVREEWLRSAQIRREIRLDPDEFVVMPNHIHGIVWILDDVGAHRRAPLHRASLHGAPLRNGLWRPPRSLASFVAGFKSATTRRINAWRGTPGAAVWQRNYWEHVIRDDASLRRICAYIQTNPLRWHLDRENPQREGIEDERAFVL
ncbi:MAG: transposase [bacterium]|jgi:REP element-mobilizing transposase RayT|nr:transposase [candidate division KSB1 bacterium]MDH7561017.1 transposase [bacterium]